MSTYSLTPTQTDAAAVPQNVVRITTQNASFTFVSGDPARTK